MYIIKPNKFNIPNITYDYNDYIYKYINKNNLDGIYTYFDDTNIKQSFKPSYIKASRRYINGNQFGFKLIYSIYPK
jgi:hypothetical protein